MFSGIDIKNVTLDHAIVFLEYLVQNDVLVAMITNHISVIKANFVLHGLDHHLLDHPRITKSPKINRPPVLVMRNIVSSATLFSLVQKAVELPSGIVYNAVFLMAYFGFLRISNVAHAQYCDE